MTEFISEDDLDTFEGWMRYQGFASTPNLDPAELAKWHDYFEEARAAAGAAPKVGLMKLRQVPGGHRWG